MKRAHTAAAAAAAYGSRGFNVEANERKKKNCYGNRIDKIEIE